VTQAVHHNLSKCWPWDPLFCIIKIG
jgi:hypothetical protein